MRSRSEESRHPLDLNNLPGEDCARERDAAKLIVTNSHHYIYASTSAASAAAVRVVYKKRRKSGGKEESDKMYECRFCALKFYKSQALGGHMNRHRQERENETLTKARQLVFTNHLAYVSTGQPMAAYREGGKASSNGQLPFRPMYSTTTRLFPPPQGGAYMCTSSPPRTTFGSQFQASPAVSDCFFGHVMSNRSYGGEGNNYTFIGEPVAHGSFYGGGEEGVS